MRKRVYINKHTRINCLGLFAFFCHLPSTGSPQILKCRRIVVRKQHSPFSPRVSVLCACVCVCCCIDANQGSTDAIWCQNGRSYPWECCRSVCRAWLLSSPSHLQSLLASYMYIHGDSKLFRLHARNVSELLYFSTLDSRRSPTGKRINTPLWNICCHASIQ